MTRPTDEYHITTVFDAGARYGAHPTWSDFKGDLKYVAFEPDAEEAERLRSKNTSAEFKVVETALHEDEGTRTFNLLRHRGMSSFLTPDPGSECFRRMKPGLGEIERQIELTTRTMDGVSREFGGRIDFVKVDTEGTEHEVLLGAARQLETNILGVRSSCNFHRCFFEQTLFSETHVFLMAQGFGLLNMDYLGFGTPRLGLFRKPDPAATESHRYGTLVTCDAVWIKSAEWIEQRFESEPDPILQLAMLKSAYFCFLNHAADIGVDILVTFANKQKRSGFSDDVKRSRLYKGLRFSMAQFLGQWRIYPDQQWEDARGYFEQVFSEPLRGGSEFYPQIQAYEASL